MCVCEKSPPTCVCEISPPTCVCEMSPPTCVCSSGTRGTFVCGIRGTQHLQADRAEQASTVLPVRQRPQHFQSGHYIDTVYRHVMGKRRWERGEGSPTCMGMWQTALQGLKHNKLTEDYAHKQIFYRYLQKSTLPNTCY